MRNRWNLFGFSVLGLVFLGMSLYLVFNPDRTGVVPNYRFASSHWWLGDSMYPGGTHGFLYAPTFAVLFTPFHLIQPAVLGEIVWRLFGFGLFGWGLWRLAYILNGKSSEGRDFDSTFALLVLLAVPASLAAINNGQTNLALSASLVLLCVSIRSEKWNSAAACLTLALVLKPISVAPWLLAFAVFAPIRIPLLGGLVAMGIIGFLHPDPRYALGQWNEFWVKLIHSYTPVNLRVSDLFGMLEKAGFPNPFPFNSLSRVVASGAALWFVVWKYRRGGSMNGSWGLWVVTALIWTIFNPRAETNSYVLISPLLAFAAFSYWTEVKSERWKGTILAIACIGLMCDGMGKPIYLATDVWLKPLIVLLVSPLLLQMPESWKLVRDKRPY
jgi:alpha-1,2-mannosyltransferase